MMRKTLQIIAVSAGGLSIIAALILGIIYIGDIAENTKNIVKRLRYYVSEFMGMNKESN